MKKILISLALAIVMTLGATQGTISAFAETKRNEDTPIAQIANDDYVPYNYTKKAKNTADTYNNSVSQADAVNNVTQLVESAGGYVETYASEKEYAETQSYAADSVAAYEDETKEEVKQVITVMTTATGSETNGNYVDSKPVANAIVRINGVPRYTDRNGQIKVTLIKDDYVELFVEKEGYNPYIEIMEVTGEEKTVHIKQPSDDIDITAVMMSIDDEAANVLIQPLGLNKTIDKSYYAEVIVSCNVEADDYYILVNGEYRYPSGENIFYDIKFDDCNPGDKFSLIVTYQGIESKPVDLMFNITDYEQSGQEPEDNKDVLFDENQFGIFGGVRFDLSKLINKIMKVKPSGNGITGIPLELNYDRRKNELTVTVGVTLSKNVFDSEKKGKDNLTDKERYEKAKQEIDNYNKQEKQINEEISKLNKEIGQNEQAIRQREKNNPSGKLDSVTQQMKEEQSDRKQKLSKYKDSKKKKRTNIKTQSKKKCAELNKAKTKAKKAVNKLANLTEQYENNKKSLSDFTRQLADIPNLIKQAKDSYTHSRDNISLDLELVGTFRFNFKTKKLSMIQLSASLSINFKFSGTFMVSVVPCFYEVNVKVGGKIEITIYTDLLGDVSFNKILETFLFSYSAKLRAEAGVGFNDIANVALFGEFGFGQSVYPLVVDKETGKKYWYIPENWGTQLNWGFGIHVEILFWDFEVGWGGNHETKPIKPDWLTSSDDYINAKLMRRAVLPVAYNGQLYDFESVYQGSKPKLNNVNGTYILTWIEDSDKRDDFNRTILKYSMFEDGEWCEPLSIFDNEYADFYHDTYFDGNDLYIAWQKGTRKFSEDDDYISMAKDTDIYVSKFDVTNKEFVNISRITNNNGADFAPKFILREKDTDPLTILWQKNSNDDILGLSGSNSIYCSELNGSAWSNPKEIYFSDNYFSYVTGAYKEGALTIALSENQSGDYSNLGDYKIKIINDENTINIFDDYIAVNPQFCVKDGNAMLYAFSEGKIIFSNDFNSVLTFESLKENIISSGFSITATEEGFVVFYNKTSDDYVQSYCALYDMETGEWTCDIQLSNELLNTYDTVGFVTDEGNIFSVYNLKDKEYNTFMNYSEIDLVTDFEIQNAYYDTDAQAGELIKLSIGIQNSGNVNLKNFTIKAFGQQAETIASISVGEYGFIDVEFVFRKSSDFEEIVVSCNGESRVYLLQVGFSDVSISGDVCLDSENQTFNLLISNMGAQLEYVSLCIYREGKLISEEVFSIGGSSIIEKQLFIDELYEGEAILFKIYTEREDINNYDNSVVLNSLMDNHRVLLSQNPYSSILNNALGLLL